MYWCVACAPMHEVMWVCTGVWHVRLYMRSCGYVLVCGMRTYARGHVGVYGCVPCAPMHEVMWVCTGVCHAHLCMRSCGYVRVCAHAHGLLQHYITTNCIHKDKCSYFMKFIFIRIKDEFIYINDG